MRLRSYASPQSGNEHSFVVFAGALMLAALFARSALRSGGGRPAWAQVWALGVAIVILAALADFVPRLVVPFTVVLLLSFLFAHDELAQLLARIAGSARTSTAQARAGVAALNLPGYTQAPGSLPLPNLPTP